MEAKLENALGSAPVRGVTEATRVPMSVPQLKLAVPEIDGFHLHWFLLRNTHTAARAGYVFVDYMEVDLTNTSLADGVGGSADLGSRVMVPASQDVNEKGEVEGLYLMKIKQEWWDADQKALEARNEKVAAALRGGVDPASGRSPEGVYVPAVGNNLNMFTPKRRP